MKLRWTKHCVLSVLGNENDNANVDSNNTVFTIKDTKLMFLSSLYRQKAIKNCLAKELEDQCVGMNIKQKMRIKIRQTSIDVFLNQSF